MNLTSQYFKDFLLTNGLIDVKGKQLRGFSLMISGKWIHFDGNAWPGRNSLWTFNNHGVEVKPEPGPANQKHMFIRSSAIEAIEYRR